MLEPDQIAVPEDSIVLDPGQEILEENQIAIPRDWFANEDLFTTDVDLSDLKLVNKDAVILDSDQKAVGIDDVVLLESQVAIDKDAVVLDANQKAVNIDDIVLDGDQRAVNFDAVILQDGQVAVPIDRVLPESFKSVPEESVLLDPDQLILQPDQKAVPVDSTEGISNKYSSGRFQNPPPTFNQPGPGVDSAGNSDIAALKLGVDSPGVGNGDGDGDGAGTSNSSGSGVGVSMNEQVTQFLEGEGDGDFDEQRGQGAEGQGDGQGGDAALGEDQTPTTQRKRGLMLQPIVESAMWTRRPVSSRLLKNLSEGSVMGTNLLDALTLGGGILYALYAPQAVKPIKRTFGSVWQTYRTRYNFNWCT